MKEMLNCIEKYVKVTLNENFVVHCKRLSKRLSNGIRRCYSVEDKEPRIVSTVKNIINEIGNFETKNKEFKISTKSIFIHGIRFQVEFEYYEEKARCELGDIIFILSVIYNNAKYYEKMTINQVKKSKEAIWRFYDKGPMKQLYLLSRFPTFKGVKGSLIPPKEYNIPNYSECLGTHGLISCPGDFALISSKLLDVILSNKKSLKKEDLLKFLNICL